MITAIVFNRAEPQVQKISTLKDNESPSLDELIKIVKTQKQDVKEVEKTLAFMVDKYPFPEDETKANKHFEFVYFFAKNSLCTAKLIVKMQKELSAANPKYTKQIENYQMLAVDARK